MLYFKEKQTGSLGIATRLPNETDYIILTQQEYETEAEKLKIIELNRKRAKLLEKQKTETDELNLLLIKRELENINNYFKSKENN